MREDGQLCFSSVSVQSLSRVQLFATPWIAAFESPGLPVHHQLLKFTQTHARRVGDAIQPSHPLLSPSPPAPNPSQHQGLFQWVHSSHEVAKVLDSLYFWDFFCNWLLTKVFWCFFFFFFSVLPVRAPNLTMQCAQIQINHHYAGLWAGHDFHPELPSFATCSKVCTDASEMEWASVGWKMVSSSIKMAMARVCSRVYFLPLKTFLK